jgi:hypothetical protein
MLPARPGICLTHLLLLLLLLLLHWRCQCT